MAYVDNRAGFNITSASAIDERILLTKEQMLTAEDDYFLPDQYFAYCIDDQKWYSYDVDREADPETGKYLPMTADPLEAIAPIKIEDNEISLMFNKEDFYLEDSELRTRGGGKVKDVLFGGESIVSSEGIVELNDFSLVEDTGNKIELTLDNDYNLVANLFNQLDELITSSTPISLPMEEMIIQVDLTSEGNIEFVLRNGQILTVPLSDLLKGLAKEEWVLEEIALNKWEPGAGVEVVDNVLNVLADGHTIGINEDNRLEVETVEIQAGDGIIISADTISLDRTVVPTFDDVQEKLVAGSNITIEGNVISATASALNYEIWNVLPATGTPGTVYLVPKSLNPIVYSMNMWVQGAWATIGETGGDIDLSNYFTKMETASLLAEKQDKLYSGVNIKTINGKSLLGPGNLVIEGEGTIEPGNALRMNGDRLDVAVDGTTVVIDPSNRLKAISSGVEWGNITGNIANQKDLKLPKFRLIGGDLYIEA